MANLQERRDKSGKLISYSIRVHRGRGADGISVKIVLPFCEAGSVPDNLLCTQAVVLCQRDKDQMQVGRFLVHVYHRRHDIFFPYPPD